MPISLISFEQNDAFFGYSWKVDDENELARQIAVIALGYSHHVQKILTNTHVLMPGTAYDNIPSALELLTVEGADPSHRDGWIFQAISWIAALKSCPEAVIAAPHMQHADKGFDGLQLKLDEQNSKVLSAIIFEDKATANPRDTILRKDKGVWKEFGDLEAGTRSGFFTAKVVALLKSETKLDPDSAIETVIWKEARKYRVSITVAQNHSTADGRGKLFKGYGDVVSGKTERRRAETIHVDSLRPWLDRVAEKAKLAVHSEAKKSV
ncbi:MAG: hypothetical protein JKY27_12475 [Magnetovibrio sp.]|nr:hypothetical protein [Magnetovibrio sp.]